MPFALLTSKEPVLLPTLGYPPVTDRDYILNEQFYMSDTFQSDRSARLRLAYPRRKDRKENQVVIEKLSVTGKVITRFFVFLILLGVLGVLGEKLLF
jgi:hypothetical protein